MIRDQPDEDFIRIMDDLVLKSKKDPELAQAFKNADKEAQEKGITFYQQCLIVAREGMAQRLAKEWLSGKTKRP